MSAALPEVEVRPADAGDLEAVEALERDAFGRATTAAALRGAGGEADARCWVAVRSGAVAGYLAGVRVAGEFEIHDVAVARADRRSGIGRRLVEAALRAAAASGARRAVLEVGERNAAARALYRAVGFRPCGRRKGYYRAGSEDALVLERSMT